MGKIKNLLGNYQSIPRALIFDKNLSDRARFVYVYMASKPEDWDFYLMPMAKEIGYSVDTLRKYIQELVDSGWLTKGVQSNDGSFGAVEYTINPTKKPYTEIYDTEETAHKKKDIDNNKEIEHKEEIDKSISKKETDEFVERMYAMYPTRCPVKNRSLGKSYEDKKRIRKLLKTYTKEQIEQVFKDEIDSKYGKSWMSNFSTFLNNFPDPSLLKANNMQKKQEDNKNGVINEKGEIWSEQLGKWLK